MSWNAVIWAKWPVYVFAAVVLLGAAGLLVYLEVHGPNVTAPDIVEYPLTRPKVRFPLEIRPSPDFGSVEMEALNNACSSWRKATNGVADFRVVPGWSPPEPFDPHIYEFYPDATVWIRSATSPEMTQLELRHGFFDGVTKGNMIAVATNGDLPAGKLYAILLHELGHLMALEHLRKPYVGIMDIGGGELRIDKFDLIEFCYLYPCK